MSGNHHDGHHHHAVSRDADRRWLVLSLILLLAYMAVEVTVGLWVSSLALIADAGHMLTDAGAIGLTLLAMNLASRPATGDYTFGLKRAEIFSALINGSTLVLLGLWFLFEGVARLIHPPQVEGLPVTAVAVLGAVVNVIAVWLMSKANRERLNVEGSFQHLLTDLYAFIVTAIAGALIWWTGINRFDAVAALFVSLLMLRSGFGLTRDASRVLLEASPRGIDPIAIGQAICQQPGVRRVDDLHVWEVTSGEPALSAHVEVMAHDDCHGARHGIEALLLKQFGLKHTTLQVDHAPPGVGAPDQTDHRGCGVSAVAKR